MKWMSKPDEPIAQAPLHMKPFCAYKASVGRGVRNPASRKVRTRGKGVGIAQTPLCVRSSKYTNEAVQATPRCAVVIFSTASAGPSPYFFSIL